MLKCPNCDKTLDQDFGMVTCASCQSVLMVDITGEVRIASDENLNFDYSEDDFPTNVDDDATDPPEESFTAPDDFEPVQTLDGENPDADDLTNGEEFEEPNEDEFVSEYDPIESDMDEMAAADADDATGEFAESNENDVADPEENHQELQASEQSNYEDDSADDEIQPISETRFSDDGEEDFETFPMPTEPDPIPVDVTAYANSEASSLENGELVYDVTLSRLDSKDLKDVLKYVLIDEKLKLNHHEFLKNIQDGQVTIPNLNPIKAKRIVEQLQYYALTISWKQKRVVMETVEPEAIEPEAIGDDNEGDINA